MERDILKCFVLSTGIKSCHCFRVPPIILRFNNSFHSFLTLMTTKVPATQAQTMTLRYLLICFWYCRLKITTLFNEPSKNIKTNKTNKAQNRL